MAMRNRGSYPNQINPRLPGFPQGLAPQYPSPTNALVQANARRNALINGTSTEMSRRLSFGLVDGRVVGRAGQQRPSGGDGLLGSHMIDSGREVILSNAGLVGERLTQPGLSGGAKGFGYQEGGSILGPGMQHPHTNTGLRGPSAQEGYGLLQSQDLQLADGSVRTMYFSPEGLPQNVPRGPDMGGAGQAFAGGQPFQGFVDGESGKIGLSGQRVRDPWISGRDARNAADWRDVSGLPYGGGFHREEEGHLIFPPSPRAAPMSPRRDDSVRMMSPRQDDLAPPMSPRRDDVSRMMSPRRDDSPPPPMSPRRDQRLAPTSVPGDSNQALLWGRMAGPMSPTREDELVARVGARASYPMSPPRGPPRTPPMSPHWGYDGAQVSPSRLAASRAMSPSNRKSSSQWDVLPGKRTHWNENGWESRDDGRTDIFRSGERVGFGQPTIVGERGGRNDARSELESSREDLKRQGQGWVIGRRVPGEAGSIVQEERGHVYRGPQMASQMGGSSFPEQTSSLPYGLHQHRASAYHSVVNQRVGMTSKYIERERMEKEKAVKDAVGKASKESADKDKNTKENKTAKEKSAKDKNVKDAAADKADKAAKDASHKEPLGAKDSGVGKPSATPTTNQSKPASTDRPPKETAASSSLVAAIAAATEKNAAASAKNDGAVGKGSGKGSKQNAKKQKAAERALEKSGGADKAGASGSNTNGMSQRQSAGHIPNSSKSGSAHHRKKLESAPGGAGGYGHVFPNGVMGSMLPGSSFRGRPGDLRESAKRSYQLAETHMAKRGRFSPMPRDFREMEEMYYDANELSGDFRSRVNNAGMRYSQLINEDPNLRRRYQEGQPSEYHCLVCGKDRNPFSSVYELMTHARHSHIHGKRIEHMGFHKALCDLTKLDSNALTFIKGNPDCQLSLHTRPVSDKDGEEMIFWPPVVVIENTRTCMGVDRRWEGVTNSEMALLLHELGHTHGKPRSTWDKFGHKGIVLVEYEPSLSGLYEAERLQHHFQQNGRGRGQWDAISSFQTGVPGSQDFPEGPDFVRFDPATNTKRRVFYGYLALLKDLCKLSAKKQRKVSLVSRSEITSKLLAARNGERIVITS